MIKEVTKCRDRELRKRFRDVLNSGINADYYDCADVIRMIANQPAPRFYIAPRVAQRYVLKFYRGIYERDTPMGRKMIHDLVENYERITANAVRKTRADIWEELVMCPAKSFYIKESIVKLIVYGYNHR